MNDNEMPPVPTPQPEPDEEPLRLGNPEPKKHTHGGRRKKLVVSAADLKLIEQVVHREDYTRPELAAKLGLNLKQLQTIISDHGWARSYFKDDDEDCEPLPNPSPSVFIPCPYPPGTEGKIWFLEERFAKRLPLWHPKDRHEKTPYQSGNLL